MARELVVPWSRARMYFIKVQGLKSKAQGHRRSATGFGPRTLDFGHPLSWPEEFIEHCPRHTTDDRTDDGNPGIAPIRIDLAGNGQDSMRESRTKITRWIDGVAGWPAEREADRPHKESGQHG